MPYESPRYEVERQLGDVEIRRYEPYVVAETIVDGPMERAGSSGFRVLAGFIFGANETSSGDSTRIAMTTPVAQDRVDDQYRVCFMMPSEYDVESLPTPKDARVRIRPIGSQRLAAIRYGGRWTRAGYERHLALLEETLRRNALEPFGEPFGEPIWARYDPPWKPWFLRRNEVLIAVG